MVFREIPINEFAFRNDVMDLSKECFPKVLFFVSRSRLREGEMLFQNRYGSFHEVLQIGVFSLQGDLFEVTDIFVMILHRIFGEHLVEVSAPCFFSSVL